MRLPKSELFHARINKLLWLVKTTTGRRLKADKAKVPSILMMRLTLLDGQCHDWLHYNLATATNCHYSIGVKVKK